jgi:hypothetical protein
MRTNTQESQRLDEDRRKTKNWRTWGPYLSERSWGTVREDYSPNGDAWTYFPHEHARAKTYRWGEDGLAGISDRYQLLNFSLALWNGEDPFLKERLFGLTPQQSNHGEDVKEYYYYLDATPTHSYMKYLYKYPHSRFPYQLLIDESRKRGLADPEYELLDTGVFDESRYFDVQVEYAKADCHDMCIRIEAFNRGPEAARLTLLPHLWFRNTWSWGAEALPRPEIKLTKETKAGLCLLASAANSRPLSNLPRPYHLDAMYLYASSGGRALFTENESNYRWLYGPAAKNASDFVKDAFHRQIVDKEMCTNPKQIGSKACIEYEFPNVPAGGSCVVALRLTNEKQSSLVRALEEVQPIVEKRRQEADEFYESIHPPKASADERVVQRQALASMIWSKQIYLYDVRQWLDGDNPLLPPPQSRRTIRNTHWLHLNSMRILSMPDKWEYPWFAAWDLAFQCIPLALVDPEFAKEQLWLLLFEQFQHANGQIPAYEWEFSDLNPPVHAWAVWRVYNMDRIQTGTADRGFLEKCFHKLLLNFTWWVNKVDSEGHNVFEGGFLGLDNITLFDRSRLPLDGSALKQADATGWMGMYCLNLMRIALELAKENEAYSGLATKFLEHYVYIGAAMKNMGGRSYQLWSEEDGLFYDVLCNPDGSYHQLQLRSLVSLIPLYAVERLEDAWLEPFPEFRENLQWFLRNRAQLTSACVATLENQNGRVHVLSLLSRSQLEKILAAIWDCHEFRSQFGLRSLSKHHQQHPLEHAGQRVAYDPAESRSWLKGGNSNWRGPVWFPTTFLMIESLRKLAKVYGDELQVAGCEGEPAVTLTDMAGGFADRLISLFTRDANGRRPIFGQREILQRDPHWKNHLMFHEYFDAETGEGLGASHQTGWTGLVASLIDEWRK